jgi:polygalacturonase
MPRNLRNNNMIKPLTAVRRAVSLAGACLVAVFCVALAARAAAPTTQGPATSPARIDVRSQGAAGDGKTKDTAAFEKALAACSAGGGGEVTVPAGTYLIGSIVLPSHTTLRLEKGATLKGSSDIADYPLGTARWEGVDAPAYRALISAAKAEQIAIVGEGEIVGAEAAGKLRNPRGAALVEPVECRGVRIEGVTLRQFGVWTLHPTFCDDVAIVGVTFDTHGHNSDGIDPDSCRHFRIDKCTFSTQDDCIAIKSGKGEEGRRLARPCEDVTVTDCTFNAGHGAVSLGSEVSGGIRGVHVERCTIKKGVACALRIKSAEGRGGFIEDVTAKDLDSAAGQAVQIVMNVTYNVDPQPLPSPEGITRVAGIRVENLKVDGGVVLDAVGVRAKPIAGLVLTHVSGTCKKGFTIRNATGVELSDITVTGFAGPMIAVENAQGTGLDGAVEAPVGK